MLTSEKKQITNDLKLANNHRDIAFYKRQLTRLDQMIHKFGQRYSCVQVTVKYKENEFIERERKIYYTDISESDAIDYTKSLIEVNFKVIEITAINLPIGKLI